jgi:hypothetical protein
MGPQGIPGPQGPQGEPGKNGDGSNIDLSQYVTLEAMNQMVNNFARRDDINALTASLSQYATLDIMNQMVNRQEFEGLREEASRLTSSAYESAQRANVEAVNARTEAVNARTIAESLRTSNQVVSREEFQGFQASVSRDLRTALESAQNAITGAVNSANSAIAASNAASIAASSVYAARMSADAATATAGNIGREIQLIRTDIDARINALRTEITLSRTAGPPQMGGGGKLTRKNKPKRKAKTLKIEV